MEKFQSIEPSIHLKPYIKQYWFLSSDAKFGKQRIIPSGYTGLVFNRSNSIIINNNVLPKAYLFGLTNEFVDTSFNCLDLIIVIFQPLAIKTIFNIQVNELCGENVEINYFCKPELTDLCNRLANNYNNQDCVLWIEQTFIKHFISTDNYNLKRLTPIINIIECGAGSIDQFAEISCLSYKQFSRIFRGYVGLNPKEYLQIHRFSKTVNLIQLNYGEDSMDEIAFRCGYYDKSHLIKDFKVYSGLTPSEFMLNSDPYSNDMYLFQRFFVNI